jgi:hypothetical protein
LPLNASSSFASPPLTIATSVSCVPSTAMRSRSHRHRDGRHRPGRNGTTRLKSLWAHGELSPRTELRTTRVMGSATRSRSSPSRQLC